MRQQNAELVRRLGGAGVEYIIVGSAAAAAHGSPTFSGKLEILAPFTADSMSRLLVALRGTAPRHATRPDHPELTDDPERLALCRNLYVLTDLGRLDVVSELPAIGGYAEALGTARWSRVRGTPCQVLDLRG